LVFAERDVQRAYLYFYNDDDLPAVHGSYGLTRKFVPEPSFWAVKHLCDLLGSCRFSRVVTRKPGGLFVFEFQDADNPRRVIWVAWSPTGTRADAREDRTAREKKMTLTGLPSLPIHVVGMATADGTAPQVPWEKADPSSVSLTIGESPAYIIMERPTTTPSRGHPRRTALAPSP
jgi:hypothetical protein